LKLLVAFGSKGKYYHLKEFCDALTKLGIDCKLVKDTDYSRGFPSKNISDWFYYKKFKKLIVEFSPDAIFIDRQTHFGVHAIKSKIPLFVLLRGHYWSELYWAKNTLYKYNPIMSIVIWFRNRIVEKCFQDASVIFPICKYLENVVKDYYPQKITNVFFEGIDASKWYPVKGMKLSHPCVGLLQDANWWGKTKELLILEKVIERMSDVNFYWAGDGPYTDRILNVLKKYKNFKWLGRLEYPDKVREYLSEIDVYALISGMDLAPLTLKEAQLMKKPVIATNVGGIPEMMLDGKTGFLVKEGNSIDIIQKLSILFKDKNFAADMGNKGRQFVIDNFTWEKIANDFLKVVKQNLIKAN